MIQLNKQNKKIEEKLNNTKKKRKNLQKKLNLI